MNMHLSLDSKAILLLTAPLIVGPKTPSVRPLTHGEYKKLVLRLQELNRKPGDFFSEEANELLRECHSLVDKDRIQKLLERSFLLSQAMERWTARAIWVITRADACYPQKIRTRLKGDRPPVLYGCGDPGFLDNGGLAVVGSRQVNDDIVGYSEAIGRLAAQSGKAIISGSAKGVDQSAMQGALQAGGKAIGVLACNLEKTIMNREQRNHIKNENLTLITPFDPSMGFNVGNAMQRNKLIYALADASLVVNSGYGKGGTWSGAVEQLNKLWFVPVYIRSTGEKSSGLYALQEKGAIPWPNPTTKEQLDAVFERNQLNEAHNNALRDQERFTKETSETISSYFEEFKIDRTLSTHAASDKGDNSKPPTFVSNKQKGLCPSEELYAAAKKVIKKILVQPRKDTEVAEDIDVSQKQARVWLKRLVNEGEVKRTSKPVRYVVNRSSQLPLPLSTDDE